MKGLKMGGAKKIGGLGGLGGLGGKLGGPKKLVKKIGDKDVTDAKKTPTKTQSDKDEENKSEEESEKKIQE